MGITASKLVTGFPSSNFGSGVNFNKVSPSRLFGTGNQQPALITGGDGAKPLAFNFA